MFGGGNLVVVEEGEAFCAVRGKKGLVERETMVEAKWRRGGIGRERKIIIIIKKKGSRKEMEGAIGRKWKACDSYGGGKEYRVSKGNDD